MSKREVHSCVSNFVTRPSEYTTENVAIDASI